MKIKILKNVRWSISPSRPQLVFNIGDMPELEDTIAREIIDAGYAKKITKDEEKAISQESYENKAITNIPDNKSKKKFKFFKNRGA